MCLVHQYVQCVEILQDNDLQCLHDVELISKHTHLECDVFIKNVILFVFSCIKFYFGIWQHTHFHFNPVHKTSIFWGHVPGHDNLI